jgi:hypothetical protein
VTGLDFDPLLPVWLIAGLGALGALSALARIGVSALGALLRLLACGFLVALLLDPQAKSVSGEELPDIAILLEDTSRSLDFGARDEIAAEAADRLQAQLESEGLDTVRLPFGEATRTDLDGAMTQALSEVPRRRLSAIFVLSDGRIHGEVERLGQQLDVPVHALLTGRPGRETDRRVEVVSAPKFGVVDELVDVTLSVVSENETGSVPTTLFLNGDPYSEQDLVIGEEVTLSIRLANPGETVIELAVPPREGELTELNNRAVIGLTAVRDRLRVLLVSGEPHAGERVWRNMLKSDPAVDLVHFTILKPADKEVSARREDLNLIEFPHQELFLDKLFDFDVLIFDRYTYRYVLEAYEFEQIARYVERGGAILISSGPEFSQRGSLAGRPNLAYILPILPTDEARDVAFVPRRSTLGERHPITGDLADTGDWGRWLRYVPGETRRGDVLMTAQDGAPLLVVDRVGDGRIAVMMSDHVWLWARGFDGGGPYGELLRRLVHWLMQEPELDEEALRGRIEAEGTLTVERRTLSDDVAAVEVAPPEGDPFTVTLGADGPGEFMGEVAVTEPGLYRLRTQTNAGETLYALAAWGEARVPELGAVTTTPTVLAPLVEATGGLVSSIGAPGGNLPELRRVGEGRDRSGPDWAGLIRRDVMEIDQVRFASLLPAWLWLGLTGLTIMLAWLAESGRSRRSA